MINVFGCCSDDFTSVLKYDGQVKERREIHEWCVYLNVTLFTAGILHLGESQPPSQ